MKAITASEDELTDNHHLTEFLESCIHFGNQVFAGYTSKLAESFSSTCFQKTWNFQNKIEKFTRIFQGPR